ncbi:MAG: DNA polymerase III subunit delta [Gammaproteobacteria bacterium]|nr:DNA polymerase III subunit delta [Gammaproteobacteria bacterium]MDD9960057.1 DNA polymerase III subunit delta [Gammaproteobacteria bacterium]
MKLKAEQLARTLKGESFPLYWLAGDEPLLLQESADMVRLHYREQGFTEREIFNVERGFRWENFSQSAGNLSLFAERKIFELRLSSSKLEEDGKQVIQQFLDELNPDFLLLITSPKLEAGVMNTKWFKAIATKIALVQIWPINKEGLANWLSQRLLREGINADANALQVLSDKIEGNLLAAMQEIEKLKLLANQENGASINLDAKTVMQLIADSSRYTPFNLVDAALSGDAARCQKILNGLREEGTYPLVVLSAITRELRLLLPMIEKREQGQGVNAIMQAHHVWFNRKQAVGNAIQRLHTVDIWRLLEQSRKVDQSIKGMSAANPWDQLSLLALDLSGQQTATWQQAG